MQPGTLPSPSRPPGSYGENLAPPPPSGEKTFRGGGEEGREGKTPFRRPLVPPPHLPGVRVGLGNENVPDDLSRVSRSSLVGPPRGGHPRPQVGGGVPSNEPPPPASAPTPPQGSPKAGPHKGSAPVGRDARRDVSLATSWAHLFSDTTFTPTLLTPRSRSARLRSTADYVPGSRRKYSRVHARTPHAPVLSVPLSTLGVRAFYPAGSEGPPPPAAPRWGARRWGSVEISRTSAPKKN